jgi:hypothetical protein
VGRRGGPAGGRAGGQAGGRADRQAGGEADGRKGGTGKKKWEKKYRTRILGNGNDLAPINIFVLDL